MGHSTYNDEAYRSLSRTRKTMDAQALNREVFTSHRLSKDMNPQGLGVREARDSTAHPESLAIAVFLDVTGSMQKIPHKLAQGKMGDLIERLIELGVEHPAVLFGAIGDHITDQAPLQLGQFESGHKELDQWLTTTYLEGNGGGQGLESYGLAWLAAARHTAIDCHEKRQTKGFLFTIGDEAPWETLEAQRLQRILGYEGGGDDIWINELLTEVQERYHVFHIHVNHNGMYDHSPRVLDPWRKLLDERLLITDDYTQIADLIAVTVASIDGLST